MLMPTAIAPVAEDDRIARRTMSSQAILADARFACSSVGSASASAACGGGVGVGNGGGEGCRFEDSPA